MPSEKSKWGINLNKVNCPECGEEQPKMRRPKSFRQFIWGGYTCANCGVEMDKYGKKLV